MKDNINKEYAGKEKICDSCCSSGPLSLGIGPGRFRDLDSDYSYGIDICPFCGGLARQIDSDDFRARAKRIRDQRNKYCPITGLPVPAIVRLQILEEMISEIKELFRIYGTENDICFARDISEGALNLLVEDTKNKVKKEIQATIAESSNASPEKVASNMALIIAKQGGLKEADEMYRVLEKTFLASSVIPHDHAIFLLQYSRKSYAYVLPLLEKSTRLRPLRALHFYDLAQCLMELKKYDKALEVLQRAEQCSDKSEDVTNKLRDKIESKMK